MNMKRTLLTVLGALFAALLAAQPAMPAPEKAVIPDNAVSLLDYGGVPDGITLNTQAFTKAINALVKQGGGHLNVPEGIFLTGPIGLKDGIDLHLERGAVILLSPDKKDFLNGDSVRPGIYASKRHDVSISGEGIIDGNGAWWRAVKRNKVSDTEWKEFRSPDFYEIRRLLKTPVIFDGRNQYDARRVRDYGLEYFQIGVRPLQAKEAVR